jgi:hypothetical protein
VRSPESSRDPVGGVVVEIEEQGLVEQLIAHPTIETLDEAVLHRLASAMKCQSMAAPLHQASMALQANSVPWSDTIIPGLPRCLTIVVSSRATRRPEIDVSGMAPRHSLVALSPGQAHAVRLAGKLLSRLKSGTMLLADRGYDADWIRSLP